MGFKSQVTKATTTSKSLRTTIPHQIVDKLQIDQGDVLDWSIKEVGMQKVAVIRKLR